MTKSLENFLEGFARFWPLYFSSMILYRNVNNNGTFNGNLRSNALQKKGD